MSVCVLIRTSGGRRVEEAINTDHRLSVNLHDHPTTDGSVVDDEWCVLARWARVT